MTSRRDPDEVLHHTALDPGTVDAILSGDVSPDDALPGLTAAASLLRRAGGPASDEELVDRAGIVEALAAARPASVASVADLDAARARRGMVPAKVAVIGIAAALGLTGVAAAAGLVTHQLRNDDRPVVTDQTTSTTDPMPSGPDGSGGPTTTVAGDPTTSIAASTGDAGVAGSTTTTAVAVADGAADTATGTGASTGSAGGNGNGSTNGNAGGNGSTNGNAGGNGSTNGNAGGNGSTNGNAGGVTPTLPPQAGGNGNANPNAAVPTLPPAAGGSGQGRGNPNAG